MNDDQVYGILLALVLCFVAICLSFAINSCIHRQAFSSCLEKNDAIVCGQVVYGVGHVKFRQTE